MVESIRPHASIRARIPISLDRAIHVDAHIVSFNGLVDEREHVAIVVKCDSKSVPIVRIHSECLTGDIFGSRRCDCGPQLDESMRTIANGGIILYLRQEGRGIGLYNKLDAYGLQDDDIDTFTANEMLGRAADEREYTAAAQMLETLGFRRIRLLSNNPLKKEGLTREGISVDEMVSTSVYQNPNNARYLHDKAVLGRHLLVVDIDREI